MADPFNRKCFPCLSSIYKQIPPGKRHIYQETTPSGGSETAFKKIGEFRFHEKMTLLVALLAQNSGFEAVLALWTHFFTKIIHQMPQYEGWPCCGSPLVPSQDT